MSPVIITVVLTAACLHAVWNALIKISGDRLVVMAVTTALASILVIPALFVLPLPAVESWPYLLASACIHSFYMLLLVRAYSHGDFTQIYPLARGSAPLLTALLGFLLLGEALQVSEMVGMFLVIAGIFAISLERADGVRQLSAAALFYSLLTGFFITSYSLVDGVGARLAGNSHSYTAWMFLLDGFLVPAVAVWRRPGPVLWASIAQVWKSGVLVALMSTAGYWLIIWAFTQERIAPVAVLRETSVLFAMLISILALGEKVSGRRIVIILVVVNGVVLLGI
ncbi:MAG: EamA family transporter [Pseudohongiellaceae bacterium]